MLSQPTFLEPVGEQSTTPNAVFVRAIALAAKGGRVVNVARKHYGGRQWSLRPDVVLLTKPFTLEIPVQQVDEMVRRPAK